MLRVVAILETDIGVDERELTAGLERGEDWDKVIQCQWWD